MLMPALFGESLFDDWFDFPEFPDFKDFDRAERRLYGRHPERIMKTDVRELEDHYEVDIDLPGFKKEDLLLELKNGYLTIQAKKERENQKEGKALRKERYSGTMERSYYVGEDLKEEDIKAKFDSGVLTLTIPRKEEKKEIPEKKYIAIEG